MKDEESDFPDDDEVFSANGQMSTLSKSMSSQLNFLDEIDDDEFCETQPIVNALEEQETVGRVWVLSRYFCNLIQQPISRQFSFGVRKRCTLSIKSLESAL